jgi:dihydroorotate dehydrogenase (fumarate)
MSIDLTTTYLGIKLDSPLSIAACPLTGSVESLKRLEQAGASAAVLPSLFEEQIEHEYNQLQRLHEFQADTTSESLSYFPEIEVRMVSDDYLELIRNAKKAVDFPVIASLNGFTRGGWIRYAKQMEEAGADAIELNIYYVPTLSTTTSNDVEHQYCDLIAAVCESVKIPVAVKVGAFFSSLPNLARRFVESGAHGIVLFNRFLSPDIDLETLTFKASLQLSTPEELQLALRWIAILRDQVQISLAATGGVHCATDVVKSLLVGADTTMIASNLLKKGPGILEIIRKELVDWLKEHEYESVSQIRGSMSMNHCADPEGLKRANYMKALISYTPSSTVP